MPGTPPFWKTRPLEAMSRAEWESLCDGCGRCCLHKLRDEETGEVAFTNVACRLLNIPTCRCADYENRRKWVPDCVKLTPKRLRRIDWLPPTCAYRLVAEGKDLHWWHPLVSGDPETVHKAGASVRGKAIRERDAGPLEEHIVRWPGQEPRGRRARPPAAGCPAAIIAPRDAGSYSTAAAAGRGTIESTPMPPETKPAEPLRCREPATGTVQLDTEHVRVTRWDFNPGAETGWHRHGWLYVVVPVTDGTLLVELPGGQTATAELKAGVAYTRDAGVEHNVVNAGTAPLSFVETEVKALPG